MTSVQKFKEFFGLGQTADYLSEDEYYGIGSGSRLNDHDSYVGETRGYNRSHSAESSYRSRHYDRSESSYKPSVVSVRMTAYQESRHIGEPYRDGDAVIFDMTSMNKEDAQRVVDFAAGLIFATRGTMEKVGRKVFAIIPEGADITIDELERATRR